MESLRVVITQVDLDGRRVYVAQCLEFNIAVQSETQQGAQAAFLDHLVQIHALIHEHGARDPFEYLGQGPPEALRAWEAAFKARKPKGSGPIWSSS